MGTDYLGSSSSDVLEGIYISKSGKHISYRFAKAGEFIGVDLTYPKATKEDVEEFLRDLYSKSRLSKSKINGLIKEFESSSSTIKYNSGGIEIPFDVLSKAMEAVNKPKETTDARKVALKQKNMLCILDNYRKVSQHNETFDKNISSIQEKIEEANRFLQENAELSKETEKLRLTIPNVRQNIMGKITDTSSSKELEEAIKSLKSQNDIIIAHNQHVSERQGVIIKANSNNIKNGQKSLDASLQIIKKDKVLINSSKELLSPLSPDTMPLKSVEAKNKDLASFIMRDSKNVPNLIVNNSVSLKTVVDRSNNLVMNRLSQLTAINADFKKSSSRKIDIIKPIKTLDLEIRELEQKLTAAKTREAEEAARKEAEEAARKEAEEQKKKEEEQKRKAEEQKKKAEEQRKNILKANLKKALNISDFEAKQKAFGEGVAGTDSSINNYKASYESGNKELTAKRSQLEERRKVLVAEPDMNGDLETQLKAVQERIGQINTLNSNIANFNDSRSRLEGDLTTEHQEVQNSLDGTKKNLEGMQAIQKSVNDTIGKVGKTDLTAIEFTVEELRDMGLASAAESMNLQQLQDFVASAVSASQGEFIKVQQRINLLQSKLVDELQNANEILAKLRQEEARISQAIATEKSRQEVIAQLKLTILDFDNSQRLFKQRIQEAKDSISQHNFTLATANDTANKLREELDSKRSKLDVEFNPEGDTSEAQLKSVQARKAEIQSLNTIINKFNTKKDSTEKEIRGELDTKKSDAESSLAKAKEKLQGMLQVQQDINGIVERFANGRETSSITFTQQELNNMGFSAKNDMTLANLQKLVADAVLSATAEFEKAQRELARLNSKFVIAKVEPLSGERVMEIANLEIELTKKIALEKQREYERQLKEGLQSNLNGLRDAIRNFDTEISGTNNYIEQHAAGIGEAKKNIVDKKKGLEDRKSELGADFEPTGDSTQEKLDSVQQRIGEINLLNGEIEKFNKTEGAAIVTKAKNTAKTKREEAKHSLDMANLQLEKIQKIQESVNKAVADLKSGTNPDSIKFTKEELVGMGLAGDEMTLKQLQERVSSEHSKARKRYNDAARRVNELGGNENSIVVEGVEALNLHALENKRVELKAQLQKEQAIETARTAMLRSIAEPFTKVRESSQKLKRNLNTIEIQSNNFGVHSYSAKEQRTKANSIIASVKKEVGELPKVPADESEQTTQSKIDAVSKRIEEINQKVAEATKGIETNNTQIFKLKQSAKSIVADSEKILSKAKEEFEKAKEAQTELTVIINTFKQSLGVAGLDEAGINSFSLSEEELRSAVGDDNFDLFKDVGEPITIQGLTAVMGNIVAAAEQNVNAANENVISIKSRLTAEFEGVSPKGININTSGLSRELSALTEQNENERKGIADTLVELIKKQASFFSSANGGVNLAKKEFLEVKSKALLEAENARTPIDTEVIDVENRRKKLLEKEEIPDGEMDKQKRQMITERKGDIEKLRDDIDRLRGKINNANEALTTQDGVVLEAKRGAKEKLQHAETQLEEITRTAGEIRILTEEYRSLYGDGATIERGVVTELFSGFEFKLPDGEEFILVDDLLNNFNTFQDAIKQKISSLKEELEKKNEEFAQIKQIPEFNQELDVQITSIQQVLEEDSDIPRDSGPEDDDPISLSVTPQNQITRPKNTPIGDDSGSIMGGAILEGANDELLHMLSGDNLGMFSEILGNVSQLGDRESMRKGMLNNAAFGQLASKYSDASKGMFVGAGKDGKGGYVIQAAALGDFDITKEPIEITMTLGKGANAKSFAWLMPQEELYAVDKDGNKVGKPMKFEEAQKALGGKISLPRNQDVIQQTEFRSLANQQIENPHPEYQPQQNTPSQNKPSVDFGGNGTLKEELETYLKRLVSDHSTQITIDKKLFSDISRAYSELQKTVPGLDLKLEEIVEYSLPKDAAERSSIILDENAERMSNAILKGFSKIKSMGENGKTAVDIRAVVVKPKDDVSREQ